MKRFSFQKQLIESSYPPKDTNVLWVDIDENTKEILSIQEFKNHVWTPILTQA